MPQQVPPMIKPSNCKNHPSWSVRNPGPFAWYHHQVSLFCHRKVKYSSIKFTLVYDPNFKRHVRCRERCDICIYACYIHVHNVNSARTKLGFGLITVLNVRRNFMNMCTCLMAIFSIFLWYECDEYIISIVSPYSYHGWLTIKWKLQRQTSAGPNSVPLIIFMTSMIMPQHRWGVIVTPVAWHTTNNSPWNEWNDLWIIKQ